MSCTKCKMTAICTAIGGVERLPNGNLMHRLADGCVGALIERVGVLEEENRVLLAGNRDLAKQVAKLEDYYPVSADGRE